ncbi:hypothetical protein GJ744_010184 [Endocarpon pusillum]|uniref:Zn(2)-C6 fungal-type domain-containing protein n=1 Tax=Endocarpon pusillum TaxID=364733 RepID=A0A8H7AME8_9EURO|nr:hypothetical protein GJ744_010184 [Endocarpon pusillum]
MPSGRKQACQPCRQKKKKCDGILPICSGCAKSNAVCTYEGSVGLGPWATYFPNADVSRAATASSASMNWRFPASMDGMQWDLGLSANLVQPGQGFSLWRDNDAAIQPLSYPPEASTAVGERATNSGQWQQALATSQPTAMNLAYESAFGSGQGHPSCSVDFGLGIQAEHLSSGSSDSPFTDPLRVGTSLPASLHASIPNSSASTGGSSDTQATRDTAYPTDTQVGELTQIFFTKCHHFLPCLHQQSFMVQVSGGSAQANLSPLPLAVFAVAAPHHPDILHSHQLSWICKATELVDHNIKILANPIETLQACFVIIYYAYITASMADMWVSLGKACRFASLLGFDKVDSSRTPPSPFAPRAQNEHEIETRRRVMWALFFLDRHVSCLAGWTLAVDDRQFQVHYPINDTLYQVTDYSKANSEPFTMNLHALMSPSTMQDTDPQDTYDLVLRASVLLGRIITHHNDLYSASNPEEHMSVFWALENTLIRFNLALGRGSQSILGVPLATLDRGVWLALLIQQCTILLYHPTVPDSSCLSDADDRPLPLTEDQPYTGESSISYLRCHNAMRTMVRIIKETASRSMSALLNPFLVPAYFLCCRFLVISWRDKRSQTDRDDIDTILMLIDRMADVWSSLAARYRESILHDLARGPDQLKLMRRGTGSYLSAEYVQ